MHNSIRLCENSPPHQDAATLIRVRPADRNNDSAHGSETHRYGANRSHNRVFTQSARLLQLASRASRQSEADT
jgi:hypothetical protein